MPTLPAADLTKALRQSIKEENIPQLKKILLDPQLLYITYISAFASPLEKAIKKGNMTLVNLIVEAIKNRYRRDYNPDASTVINKAIVQAAQEGKTEFIKKLYAERGNLSTNLKSDLTALHTAVVGGHVAATQEILMANRQTQLPGDEALKVAIDRDNLEMRTVLLSEQYNLVISPPLREQALMKMEPSLTLSTEASFPTGWQAVATVGGRSDPLSSTPSKPAAAIDLLRDVTPTLDPKAFASMMQMMQVMMQSKSPELSMSRAADSTSGEARPATPITKPPL